MEDPQEGHPRGASAGPTPQPRGHQGAGHEADPAGRQRQVEEIEGDEGDGGGDRHWIPQIRRPRLRQGPHPREAIAGEHGDDAASDDHHHHDDDVDHRPHRWGGAAAEHTEGLEVVHPVCEHHHCEQADEHQVAAVSGADKGAADGDAQRRDEREVNDRHADGRQPPGQPDCEAARDPQPRQGHERLAKEGARGGPLGHSRQQKTRDHRQGEPEEHLVGVPGDAAQAPGQGQRPHQPQHPPGHQEDRRDGSQEEEGAKARLPEGPSPWVGCRLGLALARSVDELICGDHGARA